MFGTSNNAFLDVVEGWKYAPSSTWTTNMPVYTCITQNGTSTTLRTSHCWHEAGTERVCCNCGTRQQIEPHGVYLPKEPTE